MRNVGRFRGMIRVYVLAEMMLHLCKEITANTTHEEGYLRDEIDAIKIRIDHILYHSNQYAKDEWDFGQHGNLFEYTIERVIKKALDDAGLVAKNSKPLGENPE